MKLSRLPAALLLLPLLAGCSGLVQAVKNQECALDATQPYDVVEVDPGRHEIRLYWKRPDGEPFRTIEAVRSFVEASGDSVVAVTNAGIYEPGLIPTGLYVEDGTNLHPLNLDDGEGNFFLKPNGVFLLTGDAAWIVASSAYPTRANGVRYATQSGPLLVLDGEIHPAFTPGSQNCRLRSGIGVAQDGHVFLAISNGAVNFYDFARYFRDALGAPDALYLDGGISQLYAPHLGRSATGDGEFAVILVVIAR